MLISGNLRYFIISRFELQHCWPRTIFILNLAVADLICCTELLPVHAYQYFSEGSLLSANFCIISACFHNFLKNAEWMSIAMIALCKCIRLVQPKLGDMIFSGLGSIIIIASIWIYALSIAMVLQLQVIKIKLMVKSYVDKILVILMT